MRLAVVIALLFSALASAQTSEEVPIDVKRPRRAVRLWFEPDAVDGNILAPDGTSVVARPRLRGGSLMPIRQSFLREILASGEEI